MASQRKKQRSLLQLQREKLKEQRIAKKNQETIARGIKNMLFDKDGEIKKVESTKDALNRNRRGRVRRTRAAVGSKGSGTKSGTPKKLPPGNKGGAITKAKGGALVKQAKGGGLGSQAAAAVGLTIADKMAQTIGKKGQSKMSGLGINKGPLVKKKKGLSNIPPKEGTGGEAETTYKYGAGKPKKPAVKTSTSKGGSKGATGASSPKSRAYSKDARNKEYDRLRKAGKTKEAEALGKKIAADARKKAPKNPYRAPQGAERKDRMSKVVKELKSMRKKKDQSKANKKGWPGNKNY